MASPKTLVLREITPAPPAYLNRPHKPKETGPGQYAGLLDRYAAQARRTRRDRQVIARVENDAARGFRRTIPASGPGRRRAKALRNGRADAGTEDERKEA